MIALSFRFPAIAMMSLTLTSVISVIYAVLVVSAVAAIVMENRQPSRTIAWTIAIVALPVVGLVFFIFFGQNFKKERTIQKGRYYRLLRQFMGRHDIARLTGLPPKYAQLIRLCGQAFNAMPTANNSVKAYDAGIDFVEQLLRDVAKAKRRVYVETYIIQNDAVGRLLADALADKAAEGVDVRLIYDDVGSWRVPGKFFKDMQRRGIGVVGFMPVHFPAFTRKVNYRNHRKLVIVDDSIGYIGGMNFALRYVSRREPLWRDLQVRIEGQAVLSLVHIFKADWKFAMKEAYNVEVDADVADEIMEVHEPLFSQLTQVVASGPSTAFPELMYALTWAMQNARKYLYVQTPYFMPTEPVLQALQTAALSGVDVRVMVPRKPDGFWLRWANDSFFSDMLQAGIRVFMFEPGFLHSKMLVMDDDWCSVGSCNIDFRSFENNFEANVFLYDRDSARMAREQFERDMECCSEVKASRWRQRSFARKCMESLTRVMSPLF